MVVRPESPAGGLTRTQRPSINRERYTTPASWYKRAATALAAEDP